MIPHKKAHNLIHVTLGTVALQNQWLEAGFSNLKSKVYAICEFYKL